MGGGPDVFADMLETEYRLNNEFGMTFGMADQEYRKQLEAQRAMAVTLLIAPAIGSLADRMVNGSAKGAFANNAYDNLEWYGTTESSRAVIFRGIHLKEQVRNTTLLSLQVGKDRMERKVAR